MAINANLKPLIHDGRINAQDLGQMQTLANEGKVSRRDIEGIASRYQDALDAGTGKQLAALVNSLGGQVRAEAPLADLSAAPDLLNGLTTLSPEKNRRHPHARLVQRALISLANRTNNKDLMLPNWGADGDFGGETQTAIKAFQGLKGLEQSGKVDSKTSQALNTALKATNVPAVFGGDAALKGGAAMVAAAQDLVAEHAQHYGVDDPWVNIDPNHAVPTNKPINFLKGRWKCNLFAGNTIYKAGFEPPFYNNKGFGEYPNANVFYKFSDKHARRHGLKTHFKMVAELGIEDLEQASGRDRTKQMLGKVLEKAEPGDLLIVDHRGDDVADGGHCRVVIENNFAKDGTLACAQASRNEALIRDEAIHKFTGEETIWILRPNRPRNQNIA